MGHCPVKSYGLLADQSLEGRDVEDLIQRLFFGIPLVQHSLHGELTSLGFLSGFLAITWEGKLEAQDSQLPADGHGLASVEGAIFLRPRKLEKSYKMCPVCKI